MKLDMVGIVTKDMENAIAFYELLGFSIKERYSEAYVELENEGVRLSLNTVAMLTQIYGYEPKTVGDKIELAFICNSAKEVDSTYHKMIAAGYESFKSPWDAPWGQRYAMIKDIDGHILSLFY